MWGLGSQKRGGRRQQGRSRGGGRLEVSARARPRRGVAVGTWLRVLGIPLAVLAILAGIGYGLLLIGALLFSRNDAFLIRTLRIDTDDAIARTFLEGKRELRVGRNLFAFDIADVRAEFLRHAPNYQAITITRHLPDTLTISVTPREPLALLGRRGGFAVDAEGWVFGQRHAPDALPLILGYQGGFLKPGDRLQGLPADAVRLLETWLNTDVEREMIVRSVDVRGGFRGAKDSLQVVLDGDLTVDFAWKRGRGRAAGTGDLRERILFLRGMVAQARGEGKRLREVDLTLDDYRQRSAARYW